MSVRGLNKSAIALLGLNIEVDEGRFTPQFFRGDSEKPTWWQE